MSKSCCFRIRTAVDTAMSTSPKVTSARAKEAIADMLSKENLIRFHEIPNWKEN